MFLVRLAWAAARLDGLQPRILDCSLDEKRVGKIPQNPNFIYNRGDAYETIDLALF